MSLKPLALYPPTYTPTYNAYLPRPSLHTWDSTAQYNPYICTCCTFRHTFCVLQSSVLLLLMLLATLPMVPMTTMMMMMPLMHLGWTQGTTSSSRDSALGTPRFKRTHSRDFFPWLKWAKLRAPYPAAWGMLVSCASAKKWSLAKSDFWYLKNYGRNLSCYKWLVDFKPSKIGQNGGGVCSKCFAFPKCERICMQKFHYQHGERIFKAKNLLVNKKKTYEVHSQVL